jgi:predicted aminopeptidase
MHESEELRRRIQAHINGAVCLPEQLKLPDIMKYVSHLHSNKIDIPLSQWATPLFEMQSLACFSIFTGSVGRKGS